jgi:hypothetical protein
MAWALETAGYRAMLQAWDFVPRTNFIEFMHRGVSRSAAVVAVLSQRYVDSPYGRLEWQAALQADKGNPTGRLVTVRVEDCQVDGLLGIITYIDLVGVTDQHRARALLLDRIRHALAGRAERQEVAYPPTSQTTTGHATTGHATTGHATTGHATTGSPGRRAHGGGGAHGAMRGRRSPATAPAYRRRSRPRRGPRTAITLLRWPGPGSGPGRTAGASCPPPGCRSGSGPM